MNQNRLLLSTEEQQQMVPAFDEHILFALERRYLDFVDVEHLELAMNPARDAYQHQSHLRMMRIDELSFQGDALQGLHLLNIQNVLAAMKDDSHSLVAVVNSDGRKTGIYYGLSRRLDASSNSVSTNEYSRVLAQAIQGNFFGARITRLNSDGVFSEVLNPMMDRQEILSFPGIPSLRLKDPKGPFVQGIDRFIEGMRGESYSLVIIAEPIPLPEVDGMIKNLFDLGTSVHASVRSTIQKMKGSSDTVNVGMFGMHGVSEGTTTGEATADADTTSQTTSRMGLGGLLVSAGPILGGIGAAIGTGILPGIGTFIGGGIGMAVGTAAGNIGAYATGSPISMADTISQAHSFTRSVANTAGTMSGAGGFGGYARTWNRSRSATQEALNKTAEHCEKLTDAYIERLQRGKNLGFWNVGAYLLAEKRYTRLRGEGLLRSSLSGDTTHWEPIRRVSVNSDALGQYLLNFANPRYNLFLHGEEERQVRESVGLGAKLRAYAEKKHQRIETLFAAFKKADPAARQSMLEEIRRQPADFGPEAMENAWAQIRSARLGHPLGPALAGVSTPLNTEELSIVMNFPREEINGITIRESASFGVNYCGAENGDSAGITVGHIIHKREVQDHAPFSIPKDHLTRHGFICGLTGSGKTNTCMNILRQLDIPFLVIEPAKSEYRQLLGAVPDLRIFTLGNETVSPFRINPFEFAPGIPLLTHIDHLKTVFNAAFPMYASMPYLLEEALTEIYMEKGWVLATSTNRYFDTEAQTDYSDYLPTLEDLFRRIDAVVASKKYAQQLGMDLTAALKARLSSLLTGSKGLMLNTRRSTPFRQLLKENAVLELKSIGDDDEKCFLMGLILTLLYEYRQIEDAAGEGPEGLRHLTLIEEAHRLLKRVPEYASMETANLRGKAVETFSNIISEIREYGEGILISDQIPSKMATDVIKNTNLKIVHRTLSLDDREMVGGTMTINEAQSRELPLLQTGEAVVHREGLVKPFLVKVPLVKDRAAPRVKDGHVRAAMADFHRRHANVFRRFPGFEKDPAIPGAFLEMDFRGFDPKVYACIVAAALVFASGEGYAVARLRERVSDVLEKRGGSGKDVEKSCQMIWYANWFFSDVNRAYGRYDKCIRAHSAFVDLWFDDPVEPGLLDSFRVVMAGITDSGTPFEPMLSWHVKKSDAVRRLTEILNSPDWNENYARLDEFLASGIDKAVFGIELNQKRVDEMKLAMLDLVLKGNPFSDTIVRIYRTHFMGE